MLKRRVVLAVIRPTLHHEPRDRASPGGAIGKEYAVIINIGEGGKPSGIFLGGRYDDEYVKRPDGWRFKMRTFTPSRADVPGAPAAGGRGGRGQPAPAQSGQTPPGQGR